MSQLVGKWSWFGGPHDPEDSGHTASGGTTHEPGIAVYNHKTLGGYWRVTSPNGKTVVLKQTDIGPAPWTGRKIDVTYSALKQFGYHEGNFPTDAISKAEYLGRNPASARAVAARQAPKIRQGVTETVHTDQASFKQAQQRAAGIRNVAGLFPGNRPGDVLLREALEKAGREPNESQFTSRSIVKTPTGTYHTPAAEGYVHPLPGLTHTGRTDMGVDFSAKPGSPVRAIGDSKVIHVNPSWFEGQPYNEMELESGPRKGQKWYAAEQIVPHVKQGQYVRAGHAIGHVNTHGTGLELGFGGGGGRTRAQATTGYHEGQVTRAGQEFLQFVKGLR